MTVRSLIALPATLLLAAIVAAGVPAPAGATSFVDSQVQAGALLLQGYINAYGIAHGFTFPEADAVKKSGDLEAPIWPSNPWTGKIMTPGTARGTYTYVLGRNGTSYRLTAHLSKGSYKLTGGAPAWLRGERDTAARQNLLLLQRYIEHHAVLNGGLFPAPADVTPASFGPAYVWPSNPWTGTEMAAGSALGEFAYSQQDAGASYSLKVKLTTGWSQPLGPTAVAALIAATR